MLGEAIDKLAEYGDETYWRHYVKSSASDLVHLLSKTKEEKKSGKILESADRENFVGLLADLIISADALSVSCGLDDSVSKKIKIRLKNI